MIIAFSGKMGTGKSTAIQRILDKHSGIGPGNVVNIRFAAGVYAAARAVCEASGVPFDKEKCRGLLQYIGTDWARKQYGEDFWVNKWKEEVRRNLLLNRHIVVDDCRFDNEAKAIRELGGKVIHIDGKSDNKGVARDGIVGHTSEAGISPELIDLTLTNKSSERAWLAKVDKLWKDAEDGWL